jgi:hypothetical protein
LFLLFNSVLSANCDFKGANSFAKTLKSLGSPSASILSGKFGFSEAPASLGDAKEEDKLVDYIIGNVGLGVVMLIFFVLLLLYSIFGCIFFCCCCLPKKSEKCKLFSIPTICHLITTALLVISIIFFFISASTISSGIGDVSDIPNSTIGSIDDLTDKIGAAAINTLNAINQSIQESNKVVTDFINLLDGDGDKERAKSEQAKNNMVDYNTIFKTPNYINYTLGGEKEAYESIVARFESSGTFKCSAAKADQIAQMIMRYEITASQIYKATDSMLTSADDMTEAIKSSQDNQKDSMETIQENLDKTRKDSIDPMIKDLHQISIDIYDTLNPVKDTLDTVKTYTRTVVIVATIIYALIVFLLAAAYLFNSCWARCIVRCDWCFFILIDVFIILPGSIFAVIYFVFYDTCPNLETTFGSFLGDSLPFPQEQIKNILLCPEEQAIYKMANMSGFFDKDQFVDDIYDSIDSDDCNVNISTGDLNSKFDNFGDGLKTSDITKENMWYDYQNVLTVGSETEAACTNMITAFRDYIESNDNKLKDVQTNMDSVIDFGNKVGPQTNAVNEEVNSMKSTIPKIAIDKLDEGLNTITCMITRCMYSPIKNPICNTVVNGFGEWIISSILAIIGIIIWSVLFILRRKNMAKPKVAGNDGF